MKAEEYGYPACAGIDPPGAPTRAHAPGYPADAGSPGCSSTVVLIDRLPRMRRDLPPPSKKTERR